MARLKNNRVVVTHLCQVVAPGGCWVTLASAGDNSSCSAVTLQLLRAAAAWTVQWINTHTIRIAGQRLYSDFLTCLGTIWTVWVILLLKQRAWTFKIRRNFFLAQFKRPCWELTTRRRIIEAGDILIYYAQASVVVYVLDLDFYIISWWRILRLLDLRGFRRWVQVSAFAVSVDLPVEVGILVD